MFIAALIVGAAFFNLWIATWPGWWSLWIHVGIASVDLGVLAVFLYLRHPRVYTLREGDRTYWHALKEGYQRGRRGS